MMLLNLWIRWKVFDLTFEKLWSLEWEWQSNVETTSALDWTCLIQSVMNRLELGLDAQVLG